MSIAKRAWHGWVIAPALACVVATGCTDHDDASGDAPTGNTGLDAGTDAGVDAAAPGSASVDASAPADAGAFAKLPNATAKVVALSADQSDRFSSVAFGADGKIYAAGFVRKVAGGVTDQHMAVARFGTDGTLDATFGTQGVATVNVNVATAMAADTTEGARGIALQSDGKIVITGIVPRGKGGTPELELVDIAVARLTAVGALDATYAATDTDGIAGVALIDLGPAAQRMNTNAMTGAVTNSTLNDDVWGIAMDGQSRAVVFARAKADAPARTDWDRYVLRLTVAGALDPQFAGDGKFSYDVDGKQLDDSTRNGRVLPGNKILSVGYTNIDTKNHIAILQLNENGTEDTTFSADGKVAINPLAPAGFAEAYGVAVQSTGHIVTIGYGNEGTPPNKVVSFRFSPSGDKDPTYGVQGNLLLDLQADADQGRNIVALSDDRLLAVGNSNSASGVSDALVMLFSKDGRVLAAQTYDLGRPSEQLTGVAVSADGRYAAAAGYSSGGTSGPDDAVLWVQKLAE